MPGEERRLDRAMLADSIAKLDLPQQVQVSNELVPKVDRRDVSELNPECGGVLEDAASVPGP